MSTQSLKEKTANGLLWGGISQGGQQVLNLVFGIFLARLLSPADYGMVGMLTIFTLIASALQESGFISGLNRKERVGAADFNAVFWFNVLTSLTIYVILFFAAPLIAAWFRQPVLVPLARLSFLSFVISALGTAPRAWLFRQMKVRETTLISLVALVVSGVTGVTLAALGFAYWGIAVQNLTFCLLITAGSWVMCRGWHPSWHIDLRPLKPMLSFSMKLLATVIFTHINNNLFSIFLGRLYGEREVGYYNQANKWTQMGHTTLSGMVWSVTQPLFARLSYDEPERMLRVFRKMLRLTSFLSFPALLGLALVAPEFITLAITAKWLPSAYLMQILCVGAAFVPIASLYSNFLISQGKSNVFMWCTIALCLVQLGLMVGFYRYGIEAMVVAYVVAGSLWTFVWHRFAARIISLRLLDALRDVLPFCAIALVAMAAAWGAAWGVVRLVETGTYLACSLTLLTKIVVAAIVYFCLLRLLGAQIMKECMDFVREKVGRR